MTLTGQATLTGMPTPLYRASPSRLARWLDCPRAYRMAYLDRPRPPAGPPAAHTSIGVSVHNVLRDFWELPRPSRTPGGVRSLVRTDWIDVGFKDPAQSAHWRHKVGEEVVGYLRGIDRDAEPLSRERSVAMRTDSLALSGRIDRLDDRDGELVVVDYKTSRRGLGPDDARTSLALAVYAEATARLLRRPCVSVELHHVPTGEVIAHRHTTASIERKLREAESIAADARAADADFAERGAGSTRFPPTPSALCGWCDFRAHCPEGQAAAPAREPWAGLEPDG